MIIKHQQKVKGYIQRDGPVVRRRLFTINLL